MELKDLWSPAFRDSVILSNVSQILISTRPEQKAGIDILGVKTTFSKAGETLGWPHNHNPTMAMQMVLSIAPSRLTTAISRVRAHPALIIALSPEVGPTSIS